MAAPLEQDLNATTQTLADGFDALSYEYKELAHRYTQLEKRILTAKQQWETLRVSLPETACKQVMNLETTTDSSYIPLKNLESCLEQLGDGRRKYTAIKEAQIARVMMKVQSERVDTTTRPTLSRFTSAPQQSADRVTMEEDYTTANAAAEVLDICESCKSMGGCPFGKTKPVGHTQLDDAADVAQGRSTTGQPRKAMSSIAASRTAAPSVAASAAPICPIRFLNQHSPEEIATYFQEHKHELPRSHEICVKRFQTDAESIRELDAKYGSLVNMIQGLGQKHQPMLPQEPKSGSHGESEEDLAMKKKVQNWAAAISEYQGSDKEEQAVVMADDEGSDERQSHFDRPLREVRIGESPSRPWGLHVPPHLLERNMSMASSLPARATGTEADPAESKALQTGVSLARAEKALATVIATKQHEESGADSHDEQLTGGKCPVNHAARKAGELEATNLSTQPGDANAKAAGKCPIDHSAFAEMASTLRSSQQLPTTDQPPRKGKCPFNMLAGGAITSPHPPQQTADDAGHSPRVHTPAASTAATVINAEAKSSLLQHPPTTLPSTLPPGTTFAPAVGPKAGGYFDMSEQQPQHHLSPVSSSRTFTNRGVAIVHDSKSLVNFANVENLGTMIVGYSNEDAVEVVNALNRGRGPVRPDARDHK